MSVTPTHDALIVALDFEGESPRSSSYGSDALTYVMAIPGVHSIERSAQEDTLLVLFNTAISNLVCPIHLCGVCKAVRSPYNVQVLFRNNFAMSRDITGLFQSFQSSASVLDPDANPMLFQSTLVIIIKVRNLFFEGWKFRADNVRIIGRR